MPPESLISQPEISKHESTIASNTEPVRIDSLTILLLLLEGKRTIFRWGFGFLILSTILVFFVLKPTFTAEALFIPPQSSPGSAMSQLAGQISSMGAVGALTGLKNSGEVYVGILQSRTIADAIIKRFHLQDVYKTKKLSDTEKVLKSHAKFTTGKDTMIKISVDENNPDRAADIANGFLDELQRQNSRLALTEASQRRLFFEQQLVNEKNALADAEVELKKTQEATGLISPTGQAQTEIQTMANLRAQIINREVELTTLRQSATDQNPEVIRLQSDISGMQHQLQNLQNSDQQQQPGNIQVPTSKVPASVLEYIRKQRDVKYHESLFEALSKQFEMARLDESREAPVLQIIDRATIPDKKSGPHRLLLMAAFTILGTIIGAIVVIFRQYLAVAKENPATAERIASLEKAASLRT
ncbi:MAG: GNVR domain-containing protein [Edaphobacter sp.]|uniref:GumC family protein n=1 Tax=Edaphobacter sp. TaxID=1934404 RepID=UPI002393874B|nr:GNVR domain-containing protein [Edaphobacter sp.]MDE1176977.1 GNVR domain-containing protein [Edaphobacter sp.]